MIQLAKDVHCPQQMMKVQMTEAGDRVILQVAGRLTGAFAPELETCWKAILAGHPDRRILIDLKDVTCIDRAGRRLLQLMHAEGVGFVRAGLAIQDIVAQIAEQPECR
jgi:anti-anti-sigma regulatory factor